MSFRTSPPWWDTHDAHVIGATLESAKFLPQGFEGLDQRPSEGDILKAWDFSMTVTERYTVYQNRGGLVVENPEDLGGLWLWKALVV